MAREVEFKFKAKYIPHNEIYKTLVVCQGYIHIAKNKQVRVSLNMTEMTAKMCIKYMNGPYRDEFEVPMNFKEGAELYNLCQYKVQKTRYKATFGDVLVDFDKYADGTTIVELELPEERGEKLPEVLPDYVGENVDGVYEYCNYHFAGFPKEKYVIDHN